MAIVYKIENPIGEYYIGSTTRDKLSARKAEHKYNLKRGRSGKLYDSFSKYGFDSHTFSILGTAPKEDIVELEHFVIEETNAVLNIVKSHNATQLGNVWITNGEIERSINKYDKLPNGFKYGRKPNDKLGRNINT